MMNEMLYFAVSSMFFLCVLILPVVLVFYAIRMLDYVEALLMKALLISGQSVLTEVPWDCSFSTGKDVVFKWKM